jgi:uncharacterized protein YraI
VKMKLQARTPWFPVIVFVLLPLLVGALLLGSPGSVAAQSDESPFGEDVVTATTTVNLNLRDAPGLNGQVLATLPTGTVVGFTGFMDGTGEWVQVDSEGNPVGWVAARFLSHVSAELEVRPADAQPEETIAPAEDVAEDVFSDDVVTATTAVNLNLRDAPSLSGVILDTLPAGSVVGFTGFTDGTGSWVQVDAEGFPVGWVAARFLSHVPAELQVRPADVEPEETVEEADDVAEDIFSEDVVTATTTVNLNIRDMPGLNSTVLDTLPAGSVVGFTGFVDVSGEWVQVDAEGYPVGWVAAQFLSDVPAGLTVWEDGA